MSRNNDIYDELQLLMNTLKTNGEKRRKKNASYESLLEEMNSTKKNDLSRYLDDSDLAPYGVEDLEKENLPSIRYQSSDEDFKKAESILNSVARRPQKAEEKTGIFDEGTKWYQGWVDKGALGDGYQFGDISKIVLGTMNDNRETVTKAVIDATENLIDAGAIATGTVGRMFSKDFQQKAYDFAEKDLFKSQETSEKIMHGLNWIDPIGVATNLLVDDTEEASVMGDKSDGMLESIAHMAGSAALGRLGVPTWLTQGINAFSPAFEEAKAEGATDTQAAVNAGVAAVAEVLIEKLSGGIVSGTGADDLFLKPIVKKISNKFVAGLVKFGGKTALEGFEEVATEFVTDVAKRYSYDKEVFKDEEWQDRYISTFISGALMGMGGNAVDVSNTKAAGRNYATGMTDAEFSVVDKLVNDEVAKREANGKKVSQYQKNKIEAEIIEKMEKGTIKVEEIESILGGDSYKTYDTEWNKLKSTDDYKALQKAVAGEEMLPSLQKEYDELHKMKRGDMTGEQIDRETSLKSQIEAIQSNKSSDLFAKLAPEANRVKQLRNKMRGEVSTMVKDSRLAESYRELERSKQAYAPDMTKYTNESAKKTVQNIVDSGLGNNSNAFHHTADFLAKLSADKGLVFKITNNKQIVGTKHYKVGKVTDAWITGDGEVVLNVDSAQATEITVGHEVTHALEQNKSYSALQEAIFAYAKAKLGEAEFNKRFNDVKARYQDIEGANAEREFTAALVGEYIFTDTDFVDNLSVKNRNVFQKIYDEIKYLCKVATAGSEEARKLAKAKKVFDQAYRENLQGKAYTTEGEETYSYSKPNFNKEEWSIVNRRKFSEFDNPKYDLDNDTKWMYANEKGYTVFAVYSKHDAEDPTILYGSSGEAAIRDHAKVAAFTQGGINAKRGRGTLNRLLASIQSNQGYGSNGITNAQGTQPAVGNVSVPIGTPGSNGQGNQGNGTQNSQQLTEYNEEASELSDASFVTFSNDYAAIRNFMKEGDTGESETQYSMSKADDQYMEAVNNNDTETLEKLVDESAKAAGYDIKAYHGTGYDFTVFDKSKQGDNYQDWGRLGKGFYFAPDSRSAKDWAELSRGNLNKVMPVYLRSENMLDSFEALPDNLKDTIPEDWDSLTRRLAEKYAYNYIEYMQEFGYDVQNILAEHGYDGINGHVEYVVFDPEQVKSADPVTYDDNGKVIPLSERFNQKEDDIRFSLSDPVEETKDLMALHNLHSTELLKQLQMGGMPYPSVAITKPEMISHDNYGEISLILRKDAIDPNANKYNKVYSADAYTPTFPNVDYEASEEVVTRITSKVNSLYDQLPDYYQRSVRALRDYSNIDDELNRWGGAERYIEKYADDYGLKQLYLAENGEVVPVEIKRTEKQMTDYQKQLYRTVVDKMGVDVLRSFNERGEYKALGQARLAWLEQHGDALKDIYAEDWSSDGTMTKEEAMGIANDQTKIFWKDEINRALEFVNTGGMTVIESEDISGTNARIDAKIADSDYKAWVENLFEGIEGQSGIRNGKDIFTPSGNRRSFAQTHDPLTIDNIVKVMRKENQTGQGAFGGGSILGASAQEYGSIAEIKRNSNKLGMMDKAEHDAIKDRINDEFWDIAKRYANGKDIIDAQETIAEAVSKNESKAGIARYLKQYDYVYKYTDAIGDDIISLRDYIRSLPTPYFEAKPRRGVGFDEVAVFVIPKNANIALKQELLNRGYNIAEYDPGVEGDRQKVVNQFEEYKFSLSDAGKEVKKVDGLTYWDDIIPHDPLDDFAPVRDDISPVTKTEQNVPIVDERELFPDDLAPMPVELDSLMERKTNLENRMREAIEAEDLEAFTKINEEYDSVMTQIDAINAEETDRLSSLDDADAPPVRNSYTNTLDNGVRLTAKTTAEIAKEVKTSLGIPNKQMYDVHKLIEAYSNGEISSREQLFREIKDKFGTQEENILDERMKEVKSYLHSYRISVSDSIKSEIADYGDLQRRNRGRIIFSRQGVPVDAAYQEMSYNFPEYFPEDITNPTDQLLQILEVANSEAYSSNTYQIDDETIWGVTNDIIDYVGDVKYVQDQRFANQSSKAAFDALMENADDIAPVKGQPIQKPKAKAAEYSTVQEKVNAKIANVETELANNQQNKAQSWNAYSEEIDRLQFEYDSKQNKNSIAANNLLRRIERAKRMRGNIDADYAKRISDLEKRLEKYSSPEYKRSEQRRAKYDEYKTMWEEMLGDTSTWKDKALGLSYKTTTMRRFLRDVVRDETGKKDFAKADAIYDELETKYDHHEAQLKRESGKLKESFFNLKLNKHEDTYAHMVGEFRHNPETTLTQEMVDDYYNKHKSHINTAKVDHAIEEARNTFDSLIVRVNEVLREQGMKEIPYRKGYFPHFKNPKQGFLGKLLNWKKVDTEIPTSIAGLTEDFKPERSWQSFNKQRKGDDTDYSLYQGLDTYIHGALDWIYHIEDLQKRRSLENYIRYIHSEEGIQARIDEIRANETYDADEAHKQIELVLDEASNPLNNLVSELRRRTNTLANKKASGDRVAEEDFRRSVYSTLTNINNRVNANMVVGSFSSALTNFIPIVQSWHQVSPYYTVRGIGDLVRSAVRDDGMIAKSDFLTNRLIQEEKLYQTGWDKVSDKAAFMMNVIDSITSQTVWRSKYLQNKHEGMSEVEAIKDADQFAKNVIAGRSRGNMPTIFDEKRIFRKMFTAFQLEVANQYGYMFKDTPQDSKNAVRLVKGYATAFLGAYLYNALYSSITGRDAAFDPIGIIEDLLRDLGFGDDEEKEETKDVILNFADNVVDELPFVGGFTGGGRVPWSSAMPYSGDSTPFESFLEDATSIGEGGLKEIGKEMLNPLYYLIMPVGGGQIKKTVEGLGMFSDDHPVAGSYTDSGALRFPVEDTFGNKVKAAMFGQWSSQNARDYIENGRKPLSEDQLQEYIDLEMPIQDYWAYRDGLKKQETLEDKFEYINGLDVSVEQKNIMINNVVDRKEQVDMERYDEMSDYEEFDFYSKNPEKYEFLEKNGISYSDYTADEDTKEYYDNIYSWVKNNPNKVTVANAVTDDIIKYKGYTSALDDIRADKDSKGNSISGSAKEKKKDYIFGLDLEEGQKYILFKTEYPKDDTYNYEIIDYLNGRDDISYDEMVTILEELGFIIGADGKTITWD